MSVSDFLLEKLLAAFDDASLKRVLRHLDGRTGLNAIAWLDHLEANGVLAIASKPHVATQDAPVEHGEN